MDARDTAPGPFCDVFWGRWHESCKREKKRGKGSERKVDNVAIKRLIALGMRLGNPPGEADIADYENRSPRC